MASTWCLHLLGPQKKVWHLSSDKELRVGRDPSSDIVLESQGVDKHHAVFKWDWKNVCYLVKDLNSTGGTFVNNYPVRGTSARVMHNDGVRFGYDKEHVLRMEECFDDTRSSTTASNRPSPALACKDPPSASGIQGNGGPQGNGTPSVSPGVGTPSGLPGIGTPSGLPGNGVASVSPPSMALSSGFQYVMVPLTTPVAQPVIQPIPQQVVTQGSASSPTAPQSHSLSNQSPSPSNQSCNHHIQHALPMPPEEPPSPSSSHRSDGRKGAELDHTPALNKASKLYGQPNWWGEGQEAEGGGGGGTEAWKKEFEFVKPGSQILRQLDHEAAGGKRDMIASTPPKLSNKDGLRLQAIANSRSQDQLSSSWVVDFGSGSGSGTLPRPKRSRERIPRPRSADPSPNRTTTAQTQREASPAAARKAATPNFSTKRHASFSNSASTKSATPTTKKQLRSATPPIPSSTGSRKPPPGSPKRKTQKSPFTPQQSGGPKFSASHRPPQIGAPKSKTPKSPKSSASQSSVVCPPDSSGPPSDSSPTHHSKTTPPSTTPTSDPNIDLKSLNEGSLRRLIGSVGSEEGEETYTIAPPSSSGEEDGSLSSLSDLTPKKEGVASAETRGSGVGGPVEEGGKEGVVPGDASARKQWSNNEQQSADSLMMASIEARMRRLSRVAQQTARQMTALKNSIRDGQQVEVRGVDYLRLRDTSPVVTRSEEKLPEWKFFNKEAHSIFRNIRVVEKWLQDIDGTLNSIKPIGQSASSGGEEGVDFASDGELYLDTVDTFESGGSDAEDTTAATNQFR